MTRNSSRRARVETPIVCVRNRADFDKLRTRAFGADRDAANLGGKDEL